MDRNKNEQTNSALAKNPKQTRDLNLKYLCHSNKDERENNLPTNLLENHLLLLHSGNALKMGFQSSYLW